MCPLGQRLAWRWGLVLLLTVSPLGWGWSSGRVQKLQARKATTLQRKRRLLCKLREAQRQKRRLSAELRAAEGRLEDACQNLARVEKRIRQTNRRLASLKKELATTEERLAKHKERLWQRLKILYRQGPVGYLAVVLGATDFSDFVARARLLRAVLQADAQLQQQIEADLKARRQLRLALEQRLSALYRLRREAQEQQHIIRIQTARKRTLLGDINQDIVAYERSLVELERTRRQVEEMLARLMPAPRSLPSLRKGPSVRPWRGRLSRPVVGRITSGFGYRRHPVYKRVHFHAGLDISAPAGTPIRAAAAGVVIHSGWLGAYGRTIIIDHGGGLT
ncbi:MAG TPA: hypothetical protein EYP85_07015, partial [Armatimonadetes bacterium]|nr:hypothetical protein [Armatimonadota bacterium]